MNYRYGYKNRSRCIILSWKAGTKYGDLSENMTHLPTTNRYSFTHYTHSYHFPGGHTPTEEVRAWYIPLAERLLLIN